MNPLNAEHFGDFFEQIHGQQPFPWQARLVREIVAQDGSWRPLLNLPTAAGKTAVIDIAVFLLALDADKPAEQRRAPMRIFFVIDRRIVVDEAYRRAEKIANALRDPKGDVVGAVADRLRLFSAIPLHVAALRGGMVRDVSWAA